MAGEAEESAVPGLRPSCRSLGRLTVRPRTSSGRWRGSTVIGPQRPLQFELELVLLAIHLDLDLDPYVVGHAQSQRRTAQIQLHLVPARQRLGDHHQPLRGLLPGQRLLALDLQVRQDRLRKFVAGPGAATLRAVSGSPRNPPSPESGEGTAEQRRLAGLDGAAVYTLLDDLHDAVGDLRGGQRAASRAVRLPLG